jgi:hypothetical protein
MRPFYHKIVRGYLVIRRGKTRTFCFWEKAISRKYQGISQIAQKHETPNP